VGSIAREEVIQMLLMLLVIVAVVGAYVRIVVPRFKESPGALRSASRSTRDPGSTATSAGDAAQLESLEGVLVAHLRSRKITCGQYLRAMERLAARDAERHPLVVPPDVTPPEASAGT
jgi:hypothetical protein